MTFENLPNEFKKENNNDYESFKNVLDLLKQYNQNFLNILKNYNIKAIDFKNQKSSNVHFVELNFLNFINLLITILNSRLINIDTEISKIQEKQKQQEAKKQKKQQQQEAKKTRKTTTTRSKKTRKTTTTKSKERERIAIRQTIYFKIWFEFSKNP